MIIIHDAEPPTDAGRENLRQNLSAKLGLSSSEVAGIFNNLPAVVKRDLPKADAEKYVRALAALGANVEMLEDVSVPMTTLAAGATGPAKHPVTADAAPSDQGGASDLSFDDEPQSSEPSVDELESMLDEMLAASSGDVVFGSPFETVGGERSEAESSRAEGSKKGAPSESEGERNDDLFQLAFEQEKPEADEDTDDPFEDLLAGEDQDDDDEIYFEPDSGFESVFEPEAPEAVDTAADAEEPVPAPSKSAPSESARSEPAPPEDDPFSFFDETPPPPAPVADRETPSSGEWDPTSLAEPVPPPPPSSGGPHVHSFASTTSVRHEEADIGLEPHADAARPAGPARPLPLIAGAALLGALALYFIGGPLLDSETAPDRRAPVTDIKELLAKQPEILGKGQDKKTAEQQLKDWKGLQETEDFSTRVSLVTVDGTVARMAIEIRAKEPAPLTEEEIVEGVRRPWLRRFYADNVLPSVDAEADTTRLRGQGRAYLTDLTERARVVTDIDVQVERVDLERGEIVGTWTLAHEASAPLPESAPVKREGKSYRIFAQGSFAAEAVTTPRRGPSPPEESAS